MNKQVAEIWVAALRSDKYKQTNGVLTRITEDGMKHCCLGVLCELAVENGVQLEVWDNESNRLYDDAEGMPPKAVTEWAGLEKYQGQGITVSASKYADMNDAQHKTFMEIADEIERDNA